MKVWKDDSSINDGFGPHNTLMLDSDFSKVREYLKNSIVITPYEKEEVYQQSEGQLDILMTVRDYIVKLANECENV